MPCGSRERDCRRIARSVQVEHVSHVIQAGRTVCQPGGRARGALGEGHPAGGAVGDFDAFAVVGEQDGMVADDVAGTDGGEADGVALALADDAFPTIHRALR